MRRAPCPGNDCAGCPDDWRPIDNGRPPIALVKYANCRSASTCDRPADYVLVVGYDDATHRIINDPDYFPGTNGAIRRRMAAIRMSA
jgi:hypothetical protein